jgi:hypothetical protein
MTVLRGGDTQLRDIVISTHTRGGTVTTSTTDAITRLQEQTLENVAKSQKAIVDSVSAWASAVQKTGAELPAWPQVEGVPSPEEAVQSTFDFTRRLLEAQREFTLELLRAAAPATRPTSPKIEVKG